MNKTLTALKKSLIVLVTAVQVFGLSTVSFTRVALADDTSASTSGAAVSSSSCPAYSGTNAPTGSSGWTFSYNPSTCLWENAYYTWDPVTKVYTPTYSTTPVYNPSTNAYEHTEWDYNAASGKYEPTLVSVPAPAPTTSALAAPASSAPTGTSTSSPTGGAQSTWNGSATISNTGADSNNQVTDNSNTDADITLNNSASVLTILDSDATSGDAFVLNNTYGGSATSGDADTVANVLNMLQSSWDPLKTASTFNADLYGSHYGDLLFNPTSILSTGEDSTNGVTDNSDTNLTINVTEDNSIVNDIDLASQSGDATVSGNTYGGDALTGDASAIANVVNMINSAINTGGSFFGTINIYGTLDGDILLPAGLMAELGYTGANSTNSITDNSTTNLAADINNTNSITTNAALLALSGDASVSGNTNGGSATTGSAETYLNQMNLVGQNITGTKGLLVMVNIGGLWYGMVLGGQASILDTGANSSNTITDNSTTDADINITRNNSITNNLNLSAITGDALVANNTNGGNATSGNALASVNLLNMIDSQVNFSDWFGVLFINVLGSWNGSFGANTAAGGMGGKGAGGITSPTAGTTASVPISTAVATTLPAAGLSTSNKNSVWAYGYGSNDTNVDDGNTTSDQAVAANEPVPAAETVADAINNEVPKRGAGYWLLVFGSLLAILFLSGDRIILLIRRFFK